MTSPLGAHPSATPRAANGPLLEVRDLKVRFPVYGGILRRKVAEVNAVDGVSFALTRGETLGLVGESGCGKSTTGKAVIGLYKATGVDAHMEGQVLLGDGGKEAADLMSLSKDEMRPYRRQVQMIFQDPYSSLNPRLTVGQIVEEPLANFMDFSRKNRQDRVKELLARVGLDAEQSTRYPHEFSGGQRQRIGIARALATNPQVIIADEPVSALDVSVRSQVINLMQDLQEEFGISYLFIAHDLSVVEHISTRVAVMYLGNIVEIGSADAIARRPLHPYTKALMSAAPLPDPERKRPDRIILKGDIPTPMAKPSGCGFRTRCPIAQPSCSEDVPTLVEKDGRLVACPWV